MKNPDERTIAIDESSREDVFILAAVEATSRQENFLASKLNALRQEIKSELFISKPSCKDHPRLVGDSLPELHGEWLFQSQEYYRLTHKHPGYSPTYWHRQIVWYEQALRTIAQSNCNIYMVRGWLNASDATKIEGELPREDLDKINRILGISYLGIFPAFLVALDRRGPYPKKILPDNYDECKGFNSESLYKYLREYKILTTISTPEFKSSEDEVIIQAADLIAYITSLYTHQLESGKSTPKTQIATRLYKKYLKKRCVRLDVESQEAFGVSRAVSWALAMDKHFADAPSEQRAQWRDAREDALHTAAAYVARYQGQEPHSPFHPSFYTPRAAKLLSELEEK